MSHNVNGLCSAASAANDRQPHRYAHTGGSSDQNSFLSVSRACGKFAHMS